MANDLGLTGVYFTGNGLSLSLFLSEFKLLCIKHGVDGSYPDDYHPEFIMDGERILTDMIEATKVMENK